MALVRITQNLARRNWYQTGVFQLARRNFSDEDPAPTPVRKWKHWKDVPDNLIKTYSERDPYNAVYSDPSWIVLKKKQLWWTQDYNMNVAFPGGKRDLYMTYVIYAILFIGGIYTWYLSLEEDFTLYSKKVKEMRSNPPDWHTPAEKRGLIFCES